MLLGVGLLQLLDARTSVALSIPFQIIAAVGFGFLYATTFTVLAPLEPTQNAAALSFLLFVRTLSSVRPFLPFSPPPLFPVSHPNPPHSH